MSSEENVYTLKTGVKLRLRSPGAMAIQASQQQLKKDYPEPPIPMVFVEEKQREEPNPNDPAYLVARREWDALAVDRLISVLFVTGVEVEQVPESEFAWDSPDFLDYLEAIVVEPARSPTGLKIQWLKLKAVTDREDLTNLSNDLLRLAGVPEEDIQSALASFRGDEVRGTDSDVSDNGRREDGDRVQAGAPRSRRQDRGA